MINGEQYRASASNVYLMPIVYIFDIIDSNQLPHHMHINSVTHIRSRKRTFVRTRPFSSWRLCRVRLCVLSWQLTFFEKKKIYKKKNILCDIDKITIAFIGLSFLFLFIFYIILFYWVFRIWCVCVCMWNVDFDIIMYLCHTAILTGYIIMRPKIY